MNFVVLGLFGSSSMSKPKKSDNTVTLTGKIKSEF
jgi:hypothetical protein